MKGNDKYIIDIKDSLILNYQKNLATLYLPLIGTESYCVYNLILSEFDNQGISSLERLCKLTRLDINGLQEAIITLEMYSLINTYVNEGTYLFEIKSPLSGNSFFNNDVLSRLYLNRVGKEQFELTKAKMLVKVADKNQFEDITHVLENTGLNNWDDHDETTYQKLICDVSSEDTNFDIRVFLQGCSKLIFPESLRTQENLEYIEKLGFLFAISTERMAKHVGHSIDIKTGNFDKEELRKKCINDKTVDLKNYEDPYNNSPVAFLYSKQGIPVAPSDKKLLEYLQINLGMKKEVVNVLIETVLNNTGNKFNKNYVEKTATEWVRQGVDTKEKALDASVVEKKSTTNKNTTKYTTDEMNAEEIDIEALRKKLFAKG